MSLNLIKIDVLPQLMDKQFDAKMDAAYKQVKLAESAPELLEALERIQGCLRLTKLSYIFLLKLNDPI